LDLPLEKQESTKNGKEVKNEAKAVPAASAASTKEGLLQKCDLNGRYKTDLNSAP
jgi:hypothetical protein